MQQLRLFAFVTVLFLQLAVGLKAASPAPPAQAAGYSLVFFDDFTNLNLSPDGTGQYPWYPSLFWQAAPNPFNAAANSSVLDLAWTSGQNPSDTSVTSCSSDGNSCRAFRYGYIEAQMKWDVTTGAWPAFWMIPVESIWGATESGEIDIFEGQGDATNSQTYFGTIHDWVNTAGTSVDIANNSGQNSYKIPGVDFSQWHTYGILWVPGKITWYFDNQPIISATTYPIFDQQSYYLILAAQEGANWIYGNTSGITANTMNLNVDWVKVWQLNQPQKQIFRILL
jgi:beta-glucanase (GH16 family)